MEVKSFSNQRVNLNNLGLIGFQGAKKVTPLNPIDMNHQCEAKSSKGLDLQGIEVESSLLHCCISFDDNFLDEIEIVEREDIVLTEEQIHCVHLQREPTGLDPEHLSNEAINDLIENYLQQSNDT